MTVMIIGLWSIFLPDPNEKAPPGMIKIGSFYADAVEISNIHWEEYVHYMNREVDSTALLQYLPDSTSTWHSGQWNYAPVVGITHSQARDYCKWRSKMVQRLRGIDAVYRLPTKEEWLQVARHAMAIHPKKHERKLTKMKRMIKKYPDSFPVVGYDQRGKKLRHFEHLFDNVSEMTSEPGIAMGSNNSNLTDIPSNFERVIVYEKPNLFIGFRCVAEYVRN